MKPWEMSWDKPEGSPIDAALRAEGVDGPAADVARSIYLQESGSGKNTKTSNAGAVGGMQVMPATFKRMANDGWDINDPVHNARAGVRYVKTLHDLTGGDPALTAVGYYGGEGAIPKARAGIAVSDPRNPTAPTTLEYADQVTSRLAASKPGGFEPPASGGEPMGLAMKPWEMRWGGASHAGADAGMAGTPPKAPDPTEGMSGVDKFLAGAGKALADTGRGIGQMVGLVSQKDIDEAAALDRPLMATGAGLVGNVAGQVAQMAVGGAAAKAVPVSTGLAAKVGPLARAAAQSGAFAALQPVLTNESRLTNVGEAAALGAVGQGVAAGASKLAAGASETLSPHVKALYEKAVAAGIPVNVAQLSDSKFLKVLASQLERLPLTGAAEARDAQQQGFNRAVSRTMGEDANRITQDVYAAARKRIGQQFEALTARNTLNVNNTLMTRLAGVVDDANKFASEDSARAVRNLVDEMLQKVDGNGALPGRAYQSMDSLMGTLMKGGGEKAHYLGQVRNALREAMDGNISVVDKDAWQLARDQWRALKTVRDLAAKDPSGNIAPGQLVGRVGASGAGKEAMASGSAGELGDLAMIAKQFVRDPVPDSGTSQRLLAQSLLGGAVGGGAYAAGADPGTAASAAAGSIVGGRLLTKVLNSPSAARYVVEGAGPVAHGLAQAVGVAPLVLPAVNDAMRNVPDAPVVVDTAPWAVDWSGRTHEVPDQAVPAHVDPAQPDHLPPATETPPSSSEPNNLLSPEDQVMRTTNPGAQTPAALPEPALPKHNLIISNRLGKPFTVKGAASKAAKEAGAGFDVEKVTGGYIAVKRPDAGQTLAPTSEATPVSVPQIAPVAPGDGIEASDGLHPKTGRPYTIKLPAEKAARNAGPGHQAAKVPGGWVVRKHAPDLVAA